MIHYLNARVTFVCVVLFLNLGRFDLFRLSRGEHFGNTLGRMSNIFVKMKVLN